MTDKKLRELFDKQYETLGDKIKQKFCDKSSSLNTIYHAPLSDIEFISGTIFNTSNIRYGYFLEEVINCFLKENGAIINFEKKNVNYDLLFEKNNTLYVGEIKMRDNHDSTKKNGQIANLVKKALHQKNINPSKKVVAIIYFVDPFERKNGKYYLTELDNCVEKRNFDGGQVFYGDEIYEEFGLLAEWNDLKIMIKNQNIFLKGSGHIIQIIERYVKDMPSSEAKENMIKLFDKN